MLTFPPILEKYEDDLINRDVADHGLLLWQRKQFTLTSKDRPDKLTKAIKKGDEERFRNFC